MVITERTQVAIIGAGPAGLLLSHLLSLEGIESVVIEQRSWEYCLSRVRAGVLEHEVADLLVDAGLGDRMRRDGLVHDGIELRVDGRRHRIDFKALTGRSVTVYGQQEITRDLIEHRTATGGDLRFEATDAEIHDHLLERPRVTFTHEWQRVELVCDVIAGCDGFHGISRETIAADRRSVSTITYPYAWLGILARAAPATDELIYASHPNGFALYSMRSPTVSRLYLQVDPEDRLADWPERRIWDELDVRLATVDDPSWRVGRGPLMERIISPMRSFVSEPMQEGRLFLAGDASHIVPPTGAKGLNLAAHDVILLSRALVALLRDGDGSPCARYSRDCLARVWRAEDFSMFMTRLLHRSDDPFEERARLARLRYVCASAAAQHSLAENYVGLPAADLEPGRRDRGLA